MLRVAGALFAAAVACQNAVIAQSASQAPAAAVIRGTVLDRTDGSPMDDVSVQLQDAKQAVKTDRSGRFELSSVEPGRHTLYVSIVGFILVKRAVQVAAGETLELTIALSEGTGTYASPSR